MEEPTKKLINTLEAVSEGWGLGFVAWLLFFFLMAFWIFTASLLNPADDELNKSESYKQLLIFLAVMLCFTPAYVLLDVATTSMGFDFLAPIRRENEIIAYCCGGAARAEDTSRASVTDRSTMHGRSAWHRG